MTHQQQDNRQLIVDYLEAGCVGAGTGRLGLELEHILVRRCEDGGHEAVPYEGTHGVRELLERMSVHYDETVYSEGELIGLIRPDSNITIEPAAQLEISVAPCPTFGCIQAAYHHFRSILDPLAEEFGIEVLALGYHPIAKARDLELIPKERYRLMDAHFARSGHLGACMMRGSASTQVSIDYVDEADAIRKFKVANLLGPLFAFITDDAPVFESDATSGRLARTRIWEDVDPARSGVVPGLFAEGLDTPWGFADYADYIMAGEPILVVDGDDVRSVEGQAADEVYADRPLTEDELEHLLSMFFPDVRLKHYIEIRMADSMPIGYAVAYAALIRGIFYDHAVLDAVEALLRSGDPIDEESVPRAKRALMQDAWLADVYGMPAWRWLDELLALAWSGLSSEDRDALAPLAELIGKRTTLFDRAFDGDAGLPDWLTDLCRGAEASDPLPGSAELGEEYRAVVAELDGDIAGRLSANRSLMASNAYYHGEIADVAFVPQIVTPTLQAGFDHVTHTMHDILSKMTARYQADPSYRRLFAMAPLTDELVRLEAGYDDLMPISRMDIFLDERAEPWPDGDPRFMFCEVNTDGSSAMNEDRAGMAAILDTPTLRTFAQHYTVAPQSLFDPFVRLVERTYRRWCLSQGVEPKDHPHIAIVDFTASATMEEFEVFQDRFEHHGMSCAIVDIPRLSFESGHLFDDMGQRIDCVYRRAVTTEVTDDPGRSAALIAAAREDALPIVGAFRTHVPHCKRAFAALSHPSTLEMLTPGERTFVERHVPWTAVLDAETLEEHPEIVSDREAWLMKPDEGCGSSDIYPGRSFGQDEWERIVESHLDGTQVIQRYCEQYAEPNVLQRLAGGPQATALAPEDLVWTSYNQMTGLFSAGGDCPGVYSRANAKAVIGGKWGGTAIAGLRVHRRRSPRAVQSRG